MVGSDAGFAFVWCGNGWCRLCLGMTRCRCVRVFRLRRCVFRGRFRIDPRVVVPCRRIVCGLVLMRWGRSLVLIGIGGLWLRWFFLCFWVTLCWLMVFGRGVRLLLGMTVVTVCRLRVSWLIVRLMIRCFPVRNRKLRCLLVVLRCL